jgi:predicted ABC-class ATPase
VNPIEMVKQRIQGLDGQDYGAYQSILGKYNYPNFDLYIDQIPKDPYAPPHTGIYRGRVTIEDSGITKEMTSSEIRKVALRDYLARVFYENCNLISAGRRGTGNSGIITILKPGQTILDRSSVKITEEYVEVRFFIGLPAAGRKIESATAEKMLFEELPNIILKTLFMENLNCDTLYKHLEVAEDAEFIRSNLRSRNMIGFIADGSVLPRSSGIDDKPLVSEQLVPFKSPLSMMAEFILPNKGIVKGMGVKSGVTLFVGGGYHGKSTVLNAIQLGIYNHIPGDGREYCITVEEAVKVRAANGRFVANVDISTFLNNMPNNIDTAAFSTENASGSTSQASMIIESIESGGSVLLMDEDTCAANFMIRDKRMQILIPKKDEPITSFIDSIKTMYSSRGISTILVMGGSGDYFDVADCVIQMKDFLPYDVTEKAHEIAKKFPTGRVRELSENFYIKLGRRPFGAGISPYNEFGKIRISSPDVHKLVFGQNEVDLSDLEQIAESAQIKAIGLTIQKLLSKMDGTLTIEELVQEILQTLDINGIDSIDGNYTGDIAMFRTIDLVSVLNRIRSLEIND